MEQLENEKVKDLVTRKDNHHSMIVSSYVQTIRDGTFRTYIRYPVPELYPKNFNTKIGKREALKYQHSTCLITGKPAKYRDPL